jgi:prophage tail gpP-like protein
MSRYKSTDSLKRTFVFIEVGDESFDFWTDYTVTSDILQGGNDTFNMHCAALPRDDERGANANELDARGLKRGMPYRLYVKTPQAEKPVLQSSGILDDVEIMEKRQGGAKVSVTGKGHMERLFNCDVLPSLALENMSLAGAARKLLTEKVPGQVDAFYTPNKIVIDNDANRMLTTGKAVAGAKLSLAAPLDLEQFKLTQIKPHAGETIYEYLSRHARRFGLLIWGTADGKVVFGRPNYEQHPLYSLQLRQDVGVTENNCDLSQKLSFKHRFSEVHVYGKGKGGDLSRAIADAVVVDEEAKAAGIFRILTVHDQHAKDRSSAASAVTTSSASAGRLGTSSPPSSKDTQPRTARSTARHHRTRGLGQGERAQRALRHGPHVFLLRRRRHLDDA